MSDFFKRATGRAEPTFSPDEQKVLESLRHYPDQTEVQVSGLFYDAGPNALDRVQGILSQLVLRGHVVMTQPYSHGARHYTAK